MSSCPALSGTYVFLMSSTTRGSYSGFASSSALIPEPREDGVTDMSHLGLSAQQSLVLWASELSSTARSLPVEC